MLINEFLYFLLFISGKRIYSCFTHFEVISEINCMILYLPNWYSLGLHLSKHLQLLIEPFGHHFFHLPVVCLYFLISSPIFLSIYCLSNNLLFILLYFLSSLYLHCFATQWWASHHPDFPFLLIYLWVMGC